jgi:hypothetical protein
VVDAPLDERVRMDGRGLVDDLVRVVAVDEDARRVDERLLFLPPILGGLYANKNSN